VKYRKKPVVVDAYHFTRATFNRESQPVWLREAMQGDWDNSTVKLWSQYGGNIIAGEINTLEGKMQVSENDYIIQGISGEIYPCKPDIFKATYEEVVE
jgi:hypothetical protein